MHFSANSSKSTSCAWKGLDFCKVFCENADFNPVFGTIISVWRAQIYLIVLLHPCNVFSANSFKLAVTSSGEKPSSLASLDCCVHPEMIQSLSHNLAIKFKLKLATKYTKGSTFTGRSQSVLTISEYMAVGQQRIMLSWRKNEDMLKQILWKHNPWTNPKKKSEHRLDISSM